MTILFIGDIVGKPGRRCVQKALPQLCAELKPDVIVANIENLAHGKGITESTFAEVKNVGIDVYTTGNHVWDKPEGIELLKDQKLPIVRPANYPKGVPGKGVYMIEKDGVRVSVLSLMGRVFMRQHLDDPFRIFDEIYEQVKSSDVIIVDFHGEATSEKCAFGWHAAGRATLVVGTHTHIPPADARILTGTHTGYVTDVGMAGSRDGILGFEKEPILSAFLTQLPVKHKIMKSEENSVFNSIFAEITNHQTTSILRVDLVI